MTDQRMTNQITLEQALKLVSFRETAPGSGIFSVEHVHGCVLGDVRGYVGGDLYGGVRGDVRCDVWGDLHGDLHGSVHGEVLGDVRGGVGGTIQGRPWDFVETPKQRLKRLIEESGASKKELIEAFNQLEKSND